MGISIWGEGEQHKLVGKRKNFVADTRAEGLNGKRTTPDTYEQKESQVLLGSCNMKLLRQKEKLCS